MVDVLSPIFDSFVDALLRYQKRSKAWKEAWRAYEQIKRIQERIGELNRDEARRRQIQLKIQYDHLKVPKAEQGKLDDGSLNYMDEKHSLQRDLKIYIGRLAWLTGMDQEKLANQFYML